MGSLFLYQFFGKVAQKKGEFGIVRPRIGLPVGGRLVAAWPTLPEPTPPGDARPGRGRGPNATEEEKTPGLRSCPDQTAPRLPVNFTCPSGVYHTK